MPYPQEFNIGFCGCMRERISARSPVREYCTPESVRGGVGNRRSVLRLSNTAAEELSIDTMECEI